MAKLNLGCGTIILSDYINSDVRTMPGAGHVDLDHPLPYKDESAERVIIGHTLCLLRYKRQVLEEIYRVLEPGGRLDIIDNPTRFYLETSPDEPHLYLWSRKELWENLLDIGFTSIEEYRKDEADEDVIKARGDHANSFFLTATKANDSHT